MRWAQIQLVLVTIQPRLVGVSDTAKVQHIGCLQAICVGRIALGVGEDASVVGGAWHSIREELVRRNHTVRMDREDVAHKNRMCVHCRNMCAYSHQCACLSPSCVRIGGEGFSEKSLKNYVHTEWAYTCIRHNVRTFPRHVRICVRQQHC